MRIGTHRITESIIPVLLLLSAIFLVLLFVQYRASQDAEMAHHIHITAQTSVEENRKNEMNDVAEVDFSDDPRVAQAEALIAKGKLTEAENIYFSILVKEPSAQIHNWLGMLYLKQKKYDKAVVSFSNALKINARYYKARYNRAIAYSALNAYDKAVADYKEVIRFFDAHAKSHFNLGLLYYKHNEYGAAAEEFERTAGLSGGNIKAKALYMLGESYLLVSPPKREEAAAAFTAAIRLKPDHVGARLALLELKYPQDEEGYQMRLEALEVMRDLEPENIEVYRAISKVYLAKNKPSKALRTLQQALLHEPDDVELQFEVIELLMRLKKNQEAIAALENILTVDASNAKAYQYLGNLYFRQESYAAALDAYNIVVALTGEGSAELWNKMGLLYVKMERFEDAKKAYEKALKMQRNYSETYYNLGVLSLQQSSYAEAEGFLNQAIRLHPDYAAAYLELADLFIHKEQYRQAVDAYLKVLRLTPDAAHVKLDLAVCYTKLKEYDKAQALYEEILEEDSSYFKAWFNIGLVYYRQKAYEQSRDALEKAVELEPEDDKAYRALAKTYSALQKHNKAIEILEQLLAQNPSDITTRLAYARSYYRADKRDVALSEYKKVLSLDPQNSSAKKMIEKIELEQQIAK